ncbi:MAG: Ppx/GppA phosphatase family protein [Candidatus Nanopelagicales bacterium]|nr:Ppx/GppA phosphatase family protein [Candidatus Nanopelagicales bacterium]
MVEAKFMPELVPTFAAIDCGTNAIRLLIAAVDSNKVSDRLREMRTVRLGEGVDATGEFSNMALERTFAACREYAELLMQYKIKELRFVATSASRDVSNRDVFITGVKEILGVEPEVISGDQEAELSYRGALSGLDVKGSVLVADIGGGSTEFVTTLADRSLVSESVNIGCVRMTERYLQSDPPTQQEVEAATREIRNQIELIARTVPIRTETTFIGLAGSVTTVAAMALGLHEYDAALIHGSALSMEEVDAVTNELLHMTRAQRAELGFMHPGRVDVIGGGALVLRESMRILGFTQVVVSEKDLLDGVVIALKNT